MIKLGFACFTVLAAVTAAFYVFWVIKGNGEDDDELMLQSKHGEDDE